MGTNPQGWIDRLGRTTVSSWADEVFNTEAKPMQIYYQHSQRKVRRPCESCGTTELYWAHESANGASDDCTCGYDTSAPLVLVNASDLSLHICKASAQIAATDYSPDDFAADGKQESDEEPQLDPFEQDYSPDAMEDEQATMEELRALQAQSVANRQADEPSGGEGNDLAMNGNGETEGDPNASQSPDDELIAKLAEFVGRNSKGSGVPEDHKHDEYALQKDLDATDQLADSRAAEVDERFAKVDFALTELDNKAQSGRVTRVTVINGDITTTLAGISHKSLPHLIMMLSSGEHVLMVGPAGTGKGKMASQAAEALTRRYFSLPLSPQTPASALSGYMQATGEYVSTLWRDCYENGGLFHFDEFDNAHPAVLAMVNDALASDAMAFPDGMVSKHEDFLCVASANTFGRGPDRTYAARQRGDAATWDRFSMLVIEYDTALERILCERTGIDSNVAQEVIRYVRALRANAEKHAMPVVVGQRASVGMCRMINAHLPVDFAVDSRCRRGLSDQDWEKLTGDTRPIKV